MSRTARSRSGSEAWNGGGRCGPARTAVDRVSGALLGGFLGGVVAVLARIRWG